MVRNSKSSLPIFLVICVLWSSSIGASFFVSQVAATHLVETRAQALLDTMINGQRSDGSFPNFCDNRTWISNTAESVIVLDTLEALNRANLTAAIDYVVSQQNMTGGGFTSWDELWDPYVITLSLTGVNAIDQIENRSGLVNYVLNHYNSSEGAFYEPKGRCFFPLLYVGDYPYEPPNTISTFLAVSTLEALGALDTVNASKVVDWLLSTLVDTSAYSYGESEAFTPYRDFSQGYRFETDWSGAGLPYTYAAIGALQIFGQLDRLNTADKQRIVQYIFECQDPYSGGFYIRHVTPWSPRAAGMHPELWYAYYAVMSLKMLDMLSSTDFQQNVTLALEYLMGRQDLNNLSGNYCVFLNTGGRGDNSEATFMVVSALNATGNLHLLSQLTPKSLDAIIQSNATILVLSLSVAMVATVIIAYARHMRGRS